jgi:hypothetical protein
MTDMLFVGGYGDGRVMPVADGAISVGWLTMWIGDEGRAERYAIKKLYRGNRKGWSLFAYVAIEEARWNAGDRLTEECLRRIPEAHWKELREP